MDNLDKTISSLPGEIIDKLLSSTLKVTLKVDGTAIQVRCDNNGNLTYHKRSGLLSKLGPEISDIDKLSGDGTYAKAIEQLESLTGFPKNSFVSFEILKTGIILLGGMKDDSLMSVDEIETLSKKLGVDTTPVLFEGTLNDVQKKTVIEWCGMTEEQKEAKLGSTSFCRFILTLLTGTDPTEVPFVDDVNGVIEGFVFQFSTDDKTYLSKVIDPKFKKQLDAKLLSARNGNKGVITEPAEIIRVFLDFFEKYGVILDGDTLVEKLEKNFTKVLKSSPETYNKLIQLASSYPKGSVYVKGSALSDEFKEELQRNDLIARLFNLFLIVFGKEKKQSKTIPNDLQKEANKYIAKINQ